MGADEIRRIDARADATRMTRSAYVVEMTLREEVGLVSAIETLRCELNRFAADNAGWKGEVAALRKHVERGDKAITATLTLVNEALTEIKKRNKAGKPASSAAMIKVLKAISQSIS